MNFYRTLCCAAVLALPQLAPAASSIPPAALGQVEAITSFCAAADSQSADRYKEWAKLLTGEMSEKELAEARASSEYKKTYDTITTALQKVPADKAVENCRAAISGEKQ